MKVKKFLKCQIAIIVPQSVFVCCYNIEKSENGKNFKYKMKSENLNSKFYRTKADFEYY